MSGYGENEVLHGVSMESRDGEITAIVGPNGSGKSTLLKTIVGILKPKKGSIIFDGEDITAMEPDQVVRKGICVVPQGRIVFPYMNVLENLLMGAYILRDHDKIEERLEEVYRQFPILEERKKQLAHTFSGGEQTMLCIARALMLRPKRILFDEPSLGLAPKLVETTYHLIEEIHREGISMVIVEQNVRKVLSVADYAYVLDLGSNIFEGTPERLLSDDRLVKLYLGRRAR